LTWAALVRIPVGVVVERRKAESPWLDYLWRSASVFVGTPAAEPWTPIGPQGDVTLFYAGKAAIELHRTETANYRDNLASGAPLLWVILRPAAAVRPFDVLMVTADPAEGEALTGAGNELVDTISMPAAIIEIVEVFVAEHHVERSFFKRQRDRSPSQKPRNRDNGSENNG
jgi:hypothetical protein